MDVLCLGRMDSTRQPFEQRISLSPEFGSFVTGVTEIFHVEKKCMVRSAMAVVPANFGLL